LKPTKNTIDGENGDAIIANSFEEQNDQFTLLSEMEKLDANIMNIIEQRTKKLKDDIAMKNKIFFIIANNLICPLNPIVESLELLKGKLDQYDKNDFEKHINIAYSSAINTLNLLDNLLKWSISLNEEQILNTEEIDLQKLLTTRIKV